MTLRWAAVHAMQLPAGAQTWISCGYDNAWTLGEHLTASVFDALNIANWQRGGDNSAKRPELTQRPSDTTTQVEKKDRIAERARMFVERQQAQTDQPKPRRRDARGRFVKEA